MEPRIRQEIPDILMAYAHTLRDGCLPTFLKSVQRDEAVAIAWSQEFREAAKAVRLVNAVAFADTIVLPSIDLFITRVDARIASRLKHAGTTGPRRLGILWPRTKAAEISGRAPNQ